MKKLLTIFLMLTMAITSQAQNGKPTKEETLTYLDKILKMSVGYKMHYFNSDGSIYRELLITDYNFSAEKVYKRKVENSESQHNGNISDDTYSNLIWENVTKIEIRKDETKFLDEELSYCFVYFSAKIKYDANSHGTSVGMDVDMHYPKGMTFIVLKSKSENFKKAIERLVEIAKEENKDPFQD